MRDAVTPKKRKRAQRNTSSNPSQWFVDWVHGGSPTVSKEHVSEESAFRIGAYYAAIRCISEDVGKLPLITYRRMRPRGKQKADAHPIYSILHDASNPFMTAMDFRCTMTMYALGWGNGYAEIVRDGGRVVALYPIHPSRVKVEEDERLTVKYAVRVDPGREVVVDQRTILHIKGIGDGLTGWSIARLARECLGLAVAQEKAGAAFFGNNSRPGGIIKWPEDLGESEREGLRKSWERIYGGADSIGKVAVLTNGAEFVPMTIPNEDAQWIESRKFSVEEVARWFRIPPHKIGSLDKATFSNIEHQATEYVVDTLQPWMVRWEQEIKRKLFVSEPMMFAEHLVEGLLRGDTTARGEFFTKLFNVGAFSQNDIREKENMNPIDGGDTYFVPMNVQTLEQAKQPKESPQPPAPTAGTSGDDEDNNSQDDSSRRRTYELTVRGLAVCVRDALLAMQRMEADRAARKAPSDWSVFYGESHVDIVASRLLPFCDAVFDVANRLRNGDSGRIVVGVSGTATTDHGCRVLAVARSLAKAYVDNARRHAARSKTAGRMELTQILEAAWRRAALEIYERN